MEGCNGIYSHPDAVQEVIDARPPSEILSSPSLVSCAKVGSCHLRHWVQSEPRTKEKGTCTNRTCRFYRVTVIPRTPCLISMCLFVCALSARRARPARE